MFGNEEKKCGFIGQRWHKSNTAKPKNCKEIMNATQKCQDIGRDLRRNAAKKNVCIILQYIFAPSFSSHFSLRSIFRFNLSSRVFSQCFTCVFTSASRSWYLLSIERKSWSSKRTKITQIDIK